MKKLLLVVWLAVVLTACGELPSIMGSEPFHIANVEVVGPPPKDSTEAQLQDLRAQTLTKAAYAPTTNNPRLLRLKVLKYHQKSPGISLIIGDSNYMALVGEVWTIDGASQVANFEVQAMTDNRVNGLIGAAVAAVKTEDKVMEQLNAQAANDILQKIYGTKAWKSWSKRR